MAVLCAVSHRPGAIPVDPDPVAVVSQKFSQGTVDVQLPGLQHTAHRRTEPEGFSVLDEPGEYASTVRRLKPGGGELSAHGNQSVKIVPDPQMLRIKGKLGMILRNAVRIENRNVPAAS